MRATVANVARVPVVAQHQQYRVTHRLPGQTGAGGTEGDRNLLSVGSLEQGGDFILALDADHKLGNQAVETGVGAEGQGRERVVETPLAGDQVFNRVEERGGQTHAISSRGRGVWRAVCPGQSGGDWCGRGNQAPSSRTSESRVISLMVLAPVSTMATRISFSNRSSRFFTPASPAVASA
ncbi:hypothetical protein D3C76_1172550 [compost metagenome]